MSKVIEISDSDDDQTPGGSDLPGIQTPTVQVNIPSIDSVATANLPAIMNAATLDSTASMSPPPLIISDVSSLNTSPFPTIASVHGSPATNVSSSSTSTASTASATVTQQSKRSRRKSMHHPLCANPEIEFETIAIDDEDDNTSAKSKNKNITNTSIDDKQQNKSHKITPKILNTKANAADSGKQLSDACNDFLMSDETSCLLQQIAEDRVRIHFLLASYNMPEIQFSLHTKPEVLQFQLDERMKNRKKRFIDASNQKKRSNFLQNNSARKSN